MRRARSSALVSGPGLGILATLLLAAPSPASAAEFPDVAQLPARPEMPDPLVMFDGQPVTTPEQWFSRRRPELKELFQYYMYGQMPPRPPDEAFTLAREDRTFLDGKATLKEVTISLGLPGERSGRARPRLPRAQLRGQSRGGQ